MTQPETEIRAAWRRIAGHHNDGHIDALLIRYAEPHRRYHTATHIMMALRHVHDVFQSSATHPSDEVIAACLYHDAIYDTRRDDNEELSARLAIKDLGEIGWATSRCGCVAAMIIATAGHVGDGSGTADVGSDDHDTAILLDADLAILGAEPGTYLAYVNGVRAEYAHVDDGQWVTGRSAVLRGFLDRRRLFITEYMPAAFEHRARANIEAELAALSIALPGMIDWGRERTDGPRPVETIPDIDPDLETGEPSPPTSSRPNPARAPPRRSSRRGSTAPRSKRCAGTSGSRRATRSSCRCAKPARACTRCTGCSTTGSTTPPTNDHG